MPKYSKIFKKHKQAILLFFFLIVSFLCIFFSNEKNMQTVKETSFTVISVFPKGIHKISSFFTGTVNSINELRDLRVKYNDLQQKSADFQEIERNNQELAIENKFLRKQLNFSEKMQYSNIPAEVIGKDPGNKFNSIIISKGKRNGVEKNMPVVAFEDGFNGLVGKIAEAGEFSAIVIPIYNESAYVSSRLQESRYEGLINGSDESDVLLKMSYVNKTAREEIEYGDFVITSGMESIYPRGIYIGRVVAIEAKEWNTSLDLTVEPIVDFTKLEYVFILAEDNS